MGLTTFGYTEYPSLIKGGHNTYQVRVEEEPIRTIIRKTDILIALDKETIEKHKEELNDNGIILYDNYRTKINPQEYEERGIRLINIPAREIAKEILSSEITENQVFLGASFALLKTELKHLEEVIKKTFSKKGEEIIKQDIKAARKGYEYVKENFDTNTFQHQLKEVEKKEKQMFITGNEAIALGAIKAGCKFYAAYPMTPATSILHTMAALQEKYGIVVKQAEDEISVANMTVGAGYAGVRAMCATSGGGFGLMNETYSLAAMTETPIVMVEVTRGGPATGIPTWTSQEDLKFVLNSGHGEFPRFVIAPGDPEEAYYMTIEAFNTAEKYQTPVIILSDKYLAESNWSYPFFNKEIKIERGPWITNEELEEMEKRGERFKRYNTATETGVSTRAVPGQHKNGIFVANSDEHDEYGYSTEEIEERNKMFDKRMRKIEAYKKEMPEPKLYGEEEADITMVCWGSTKQMALQSMKWLNNEGIKTNVLHITHISPFPAEAVSRILKKAKRILNIEHNKTAQMAEIIRANTGIEIKEHLLKNDGRPIFPEEITDKARSMMKGVEL